MGLPCGSAGKESTCNVGDLGLIPGLGRSPGEGKGYPLQDSGLENSWTVRSTGSQRVRRDWAAFTSLHATPCHCQDQHHEAFAPCFLLEVLQFWIFNPFWVDLCVVWVQLYYLVWGYPVFQHHLLKRRSFPHCVFLAPVKNITWPLRAWVYFWALYSATYVCPSTSTFFFDYIAL